MRELLWAQNGHWFNNVQLRHPLYQIAPPPRIFLIKLVHGGGQLALAASQGVRMLFAKLLPHCPASVQSAQADFVSPAPDFNMGNQTYRSVVFHSGINLSKSIRGEGPGMRACAGTRNEARLQPHGICYNTPSTLPGLSRITVASSCSPWSRMSCCSAALCRVLPAITQWRSPRSTMP